MEPSKVRFAIVLPNSCTSRATDFARHRHVCTGRRSSRRSSDSIPEVYFKLAGGSFPVYLGFAVHFFEVKDAHRRWTQAQPAKLVLPIEG
jgi:hypothetical protein